jgi:hypothetical protein
MSRAVLSASRYSELKSTMKNFIFYFLIFTSNIVFSQNDSYCVIKNDIYPLINNKDYEGAKKLWLIMEKQHNVDPNSEYLFLIEALANDDIEFYKSRIPSLIEDHGYHFFASDTLLENLRWDFEIIINKGLHKWLINTSNELYPNWIKKKPESYSLQQQIIQLAHNDQLFRTSIHFAEVSDTNCTGKELDWDILSRCDYENAAKLATLCIRNGGLPNHFDNGYKTYALMDLIIWHNLKSEDNIHNAWMILSPHIDKAYLEGKIGSGFYASYDYWLLHFTGYQYYGFEGNAPVENQNEFEKRKEKYKFCY